MVSAVEDVQGGVVEDVEGGADEDVQGGGSLQVRDVREHGVEDMQEVDVIGDAPVLWFADQSLVDSPVRKLEHGESPLVSCPYCGWMYSQRQTLARHLKYECCWV